MNTDSILFLSVLIREIRGEPVCIPAFAKTIPAKFEPDARRRAA